MNKIKIKTYDGMYYTYATTDKIEEVIATLNKELKENEFIYLPIENKIINVKEVKETLISTI